MKFLSICSGIEAASVAFTPLGWSAVGFSEIEPFPCELLAYRYPDVPNFGDMAMYKTWPVSVFLNADVIVGGPPCQSFSVAGHRKGLNDDRGNLTLIYTELIDYADAIRVMHGKPPVIVLYENVPGILSDKTNAFGSFLGALAGESDALNPSGRKWTNAGAVLGPQRAIAWRVLDAQYFGLAQRRRRVFVVASARNGFRGHEILFEFDGVRRDTPPSRESGQATTRYARVSAYESSAGNADEQISRSLSFDCKQEGSGVSDQGVFRWPPELSQGVPKTHKELVATFDRQSASEYGTSNVASTIAARDYKSATDLVAYGVPGNWIGRKPENGGNSTQFMHEIAPNQTATDRHGVVAFAQNGGQENAIIAFSCKDYGGDSTNNLSPTLRAMGHSGSHANGGGQVAVAFAQNTRNEVRYISGDGQIAGALAANPGMKQTTYLAFNSRQDPVSGESGQENLTPWEKQGRRVQGMNGVSPTLMSNPAGGVKQATYLAFNSRQDPVSGEVAGSLDTCSPQAQAVVTVSLRGREGGGVAEVRSTISNALRASNGGGDKSYALTQSSVRRLTPVECERLQGFPDYYGAIPWRGKPADECPDGHRYKSLGNSWAVPVVAWIGKRIHAEHERLTKIEKPASRKTTTPKQKKGVV